MDIRNFCHVEKSSEDEVRAPVEKRPRTDLLDSDESSDIGASEVEEDDVEDIFGQPVDVNISSPQKILTSQKQKTSSSTGPGDISQLPDDGRTQPGLKKEFQPSFFKTLITHRFMDFCLKEFAPPNIILPLKCPSKFSDLAPPLFVR